MGLIPFKTPREELRLALPFQGHADDAVDPALCLPGGAAAFIPGVARQVKPLAVWAQRRRARKGLDRLGTFAIMGVEGRKACFGPAQLQAAAAPVRGHAVQKNSSQRDPLAPHGQRARGRIGRPPIEVLERQKPVQAVTGLRVETGIVPAGKKSRLVVAFF